MQVFTDMLITHDDPIRHSDYQGSTRSLRREGAKLPWDGKDFIAWDGEGTKSKVSRLPSEWILTARKFIEHTTGEKMEDWLEYYDDDEPQPQPYVLLANSLGKHIKESPENDGLSTMACFDFILDTRRENPHSIFVGFGFTYDSAQILKDLPWRRLAQLYANNVTWYGKYRIEYLPRHWLQVTDREKKITAKIYDVIGFFQSSFIEACEKYLGVNDPDLDRVRAGKADRSIFEWEELDDKILPYCNTELDMLVRMMNILRKDFHEVGLDLKEWYGPGAVANQLFKDNHIEDVMSKDLPREVRDASQFAYAGGRFEQFYIGIHHSAIFEYDIRSAYPAAIARLPQLSEGTWDFVDGFESGTFGVWFIDYRASERDNRPQPLFCRAKNGSVSFPYEADGWYWTPEAELVAEHVQCGYVWRPTNERKAFPFVEGIYTQRAEYKRRGISSERALKLILNSLYGKLAQIVGPLDKQGNYKQPKWHQLEWAGYITSYTRAMIYKAILTSPDAVIAVETDAVFSTEPLPLDVGEGLGQWELTTFDNIMYLQSGFYYAHQSGKPEKEIVCRFRGMDRDRAGEFPAGLPYRTVVDHLCDWRKPNDWRTRPLISSTTRFVNIGLALATSAVYRSWETRKKRLVLDQNPRRCKRSHVKCQRCREGKYLGHCLHPLTLSGYSGWSYPHHLPWVDQELDQELAGYLDMLEQDFWQ